MRVYLAGPEVFLPNARIILDLKGSLTRSAGFEPVSPGDVAIDTMPDKHELGLAISVVNERLMKSADAIIANLTPFRGISADAGTVYELGFMCGQGKLAFAYTNLADDYFLRTVAYYGGKVITGLDGRNRGHDGLSIENFDMVDNLMVDGGIDSCGGSIVRGNVAPEERYTNMRAFKECLKMVALSFGVS